jgi:uncharacterized protein (TIGR03790 family)
MEKLPPQQRMEAMRQFLPLHQHVSGIRGLLNSLQVPADVPAGDPARRQLATLQGQLKELEEQYSALMPQRDSARIRRELVDLAQKAEGVVGEARLIEQMLAYLQPDNSASCLDNELALVLAEQSYSRANWIINPRNLEVWPSTQIKGSATPPATLMVCRIDGSSPARAMELVDLAIKTEEKGLDGKIYLDARGLRGTDAYAAYDADIRRAADWLKQHASMEVVLEDTDALLAAKDAPAAALYCGWYSVHQYQESCQWVKGAVGFHVASFEMMTLHTPKEPGWVVNLLDRGFAGTLGPTDEPYLTSFPKPSLFFPLLLSGDFTQGEVWQLTTPMLSWREGYVGDPLYNPFKARPRVKGEDLLAHPVLRIAYQELSRSVSTAPAPQN